MTVRLSALTAVRAADRVVRSARTGRTNPGIARTATCPGRVIADQRRTGRTARSGSAPIRRTAPGTRTGFRITIQGSRNAVR